LFSLHNSTPRALMLRCRKIMALTVIQRGYRSEVGLTDLFDQVIA
jgi:hypothetical protein